MRAPAAGKSARSALIWLILGVLALTGLSPGSAHAQGDASAVAGQTFQIATDSSYPPHVVRAEDNSITGFDIDLMNAIAEDQGFEIEYQALGFAAALQAVSAGQADGVIAAAGITEERKQSFDFSDPYLESQLAIAVRQGEADQFAEWADFAGTTVMAKTGSLSLEHVEEKAAEFGFEVRSLDQSDPMYQEVNLGRADGVMDDYTVLAYGVNQGNGLELTMDPIPVGELGFAVAKGENEQLLNAFNRGLDNLKADGTYDQLLADYFGEEAAAEQRGFLDLLSSSLPVLLKGLGITLLVTAVAILMARSSASSSALPRSRGSPTSNGWPTPTSMSSEAHHCWSRPSSSTSAYLQQSGSTSASCGRASWCCPSTPGPT